MPIFDALISRRAKASLQREIDELNQAALRHAQRLNMPPDRSALWEACCNEASSVIAQLFISNSDKQLDWGLKGHRKKLNQPRLVAVYWWMLLYELVLLKNRGVEGYHAEDEFGELSHAAHEFIEHLVREPDYDALNPGPWEGRWRSQVSLEAALGVYNRTMELLGLNVDPEARIFRVSHFTSATERGYDANVKAALERNGTV